MSEPSTTGRCLCGRVRFELSEPAKWEPIPDDGLARFEEARS